MYAVDLHAHSRFFHLFPGRETLFDRFGVELLVRLARRRGLDGIALTNHDYHAEFDTGIDFPVVPGIEVSTTRGHVLVVGPDPPTCTNPTELTPAETVELAHRHDCAAVIAHPFRNSTVRDVDAPFDAVEANGKHPSTRPQAERIARERELPMTGGSDAHYPVEVGRAYTRVDAEELTPESVVAAIRDGRVEPVYRNGSFDRRVGVLYDAVHRLKGHR